jgi:hypothetical protein
MSATTPDRLAYMANQIAANLALTDDPVAATAEHIHSFWTRAMQQTLIETASDQLHPIARKAMAQLGDSAPAEHQVRATDPVHQGSDAG